MKILVTGSSGFVGEHLLERLNRRHQITKYDRKNGQNVLNERLLLKKLSGIEVVVHLAALISAEESWIKPRDYLLNNTLGTLSVFENSRKAGVKKVIYFSSAAAKHKLSSPYALSKKSAEEIAKMYSKELATDIVRPENIYGPGQNMAYGYVIHNFIKAVKNDSSIKIYGNGLQIRDFIYIDDVVSVVEKLIKTDSVNETINLGTGVGTSIIHLSKLVENAMKKSVRTEHLPKRKEVFTSVADTKSLLSVGIKPKDFLDIRRGIKKLIRIEYSNEK